MEITKEMVEGTATRLKLRQLTGGKVCTVPWEPKLQYRWDDGVACSQDFTVSRLRAKVSSMYGSALATRRMGRNEPSPTRNRTIDLGPPSKRLTRISAAGTSSAVKRPSCSSPVRKSRRPSWPSP